MGIVGAAASLGFSCDLDDHTYELIAYRKPENCGRRRAVEPESVVEMEAGPYLSACYEIAHPVRHPMGEDVHLTRLPFDLGLLHYASDTPYTRARTLGARKLSYYGMDSTYASTVAIWRRILKRESSRQ